jgi:hypothetical protein
MLWITACCFALAGCARDVNEGIDENPYPDQVRIAFRTRQTFSSDYWYYMVFNYSAAPIETDTLGPLDEISDENRCANWEMYIAYHKDPSSGEQLVTLQRPRVPTILGTGAMPVDTAAGMLTDDPVMDLLVACKDGDVVQLIKGIKPDPNDPAYFEEAKAFDTGPQPIRVNVEDYTADGTADASIIYAGRGANPAVLRVLSQSAPGVFTKLADVPITDTPISAIPYDLNGDASKDWVVLTQNSETKAMNVRVFGHNGGGEFITSDVYPVGATACQVICGQVNGTDTGMDILVAERGTQGGNGRAVILNGDGKGGFTVGPAVEVDGNVNSIALGVFSDSSNVINDLLVGYVTADSQGRVGLWKNDGHQVFTPDSALVMPVIPTYVTAMDTNDDRVSDAMILDGDPSGNKGSSLYIVRGKRELEEGSITLTFKWDTTLIDYLTGTSPTSLNALDLSGDGLSDLMIPNSGSNTNGNSICVFHALGHTNYTNADIYWTDDLPELLGSRDWLLSQSIGSNYMEIVIDPGVFYDLARLGLERGRGVNVTFMTATTGVWYEANQNHDGLVCDILDHPVNIPMDVGHYDDDQNTQLADTHVYSDPAADIDDWVVEVN